MKLQTRSNPAFATPRSVWWLNPAVAFGIPSSVAGLVAYQTSPTGFLVHWRTAKYFDGLSLVLLLSIVALFVCGCLFGASRRTGSDKYAGADWKRDWKNDIPWPTVKLLFRLSFVLTLIGYAIWFVSSVRHGISLNILIENLQGTGSSDLKEEYLTNIPGLTTATQFGIAVIALGVPLGAALGWRAVRWPCFSVLLMALVRALVNSERLALIELLVPLVVSLVWLYPPTTRSMRALTNFAPVIGVTLLYAFFSCAEYFRSWASFYSKYESNFWSFMGLRLMGYYATALNNGALIWKAKQAVHLTLPYATLSFAFHFPGLKFLLAALFPSIPGEVPSHYQDLLKSSANPELTNASGIFAPIFDFNIAGGLLYWLLSGVICGYLYREFRMRRTAGLFLYPVLFMPLIEAPRILYWANGRLFPAMFLLVSSVLFLLRTRGESLRRKHLPVRGFEAVQEI